MGACLPLSEVHFIHAEPFLLHVTCHVTYNVMSCHVMSHVMSCHIFHTISHVMSYHMSFHI